MDDDSQARDSFLTLYIQKQEQLLLDYLRKNIEAEIKVAALTNSFQDATLQYEESQKQVELQNDMMQQAAKGLESTTLEKKQLEEKEKELNNKIIEITNNYENRIKEYETVISQTRQELAKANGFETQFNDIKREYENQKNELNNIYKENQDLKKKLPPEKPIKKISKPVFLDDNDF
jgi:chromosome segregation ATPase